MTDRRMPELGDNPLEVAFRDYKRMEHELALATQEHAAKTDMLNDLLRENEFLRRNYDKAVAERDRYQALAVNLATRAVGVQEAVERLLVEAMKAGANPALPSTVQPPNRSIEAVGMAHDVEQEMAALLRLPNSSGRDITARATAAVPPNRFQ